VRVQGSTQAEALLVIVGVGKGIVRATRGGRASQVEEPIGREVVLPRRQRGGGRTGQGHQERREAHAQGRRFGGGGSRGAVRERVDLVRHSLSPTGVKITRHG
jgi:hypothetical protein